IQRYLLKKSCEAIQNDKLHSSFSRLKIKVSFRKWMGGFELLPFPSNSEISFATF
ncbi:hypothetical protein LCGC14_2463440, partial [marine sediment metagenome]